MATRVIKTNEITGTKNNPTKVHSWDLWRDKNFIYVKSHSKADGKNFYKFKNEEGVIGLFNSTKKKYAYFRNKQLQDFLERHGIDFVKHETPNQTFFITSDEYTEYDIQTDGNIKIEYTEILYNKYATISNATYAIVVEKWKKNGRTRKHLYTKENVFELEKKLKTG